MSPLLHHLQNLELELHHALLAAQDIIEEVKALETPSSRPTIASSSSIPWQEAPSPMEEYEAPSAPPPPPPLSYAPSPSVRPGLLTNPLKTLVTDVTCRNLASKTKPGQTFPLWDIVTGAAKFGTLDKKAAAVATDAKINGVPILIQWKSRVNGTFTNYDVVSLQKA